MRKVLIAIFLLLLLVGCGSADTEEAKTEEELRAEIEEELRGEMEEEAEEDAFNEETVTEDVYEDDVVEDEVKDEAAVVESIGDNKILEFDVTDEGIYLLMDGSYEVEGKILYSMVEEEFLFYPNEEAIDQFDTYSYTYTGDNVMANGETFDITPPIGLLQIEDKTISYLIGAEGIEALKNLNESPSDAEGISVKCRLSEYSEVYFFGSEILTSANVEILEYDEGFLEEHVYSSYPKTIAGKNVLNYSYDGEEIDFELDGTFEDIEGIVHYDPMFEGYAIYCDETQYEKYAIDFNGTMINIDPPSGYYFMQEDELTSLSVSDFQAISNGEQIPVTFNVTNYSFKGEIGGGTSASGDITITSVGSEEEAKGYLNDFADESLYSLDEAKTIDYSLYKLVVIPMQDSIHASDLTTRTVNITETGTETDLKFTVIGKLALINISYSINAIDENAEVIELTIDGPIENEVITLKANLPNDFSTVVVECLYQYQAGIEGVTFSLDDMRDNTTYEIITIDDDGWAE